MNLKFIFMVQAAFEGSDREKRNQNESKQQEHSFPRLFSVVPKKGFIVIMFWFSKLSTGL